ncbi:MAG: alpha/beta hydrolase [Aquaticitalea sp.]
MKRRYKVAIVIIIILSFGFYIATVHILPFAIIKPYRAVGVNKLDGQNLNYKKIDVKTFDSINLKGYYVKSLQDKTLASIILVHGIGGCKENFTNLAIKLAQQGYDIWLFDNRAHGQSGGLYSTYGFYEKRDISEIVSTIKEETPNTKIGIWGNSLGGAISVQALADDKRIDFGIIESSFSDLRQIVYDYQKRFTYGLGLKFASDIALDEAGKIAKFNPDEIKPIQSATQITQPVLIIHGDADLNIDVKYGKALYKAIGSDEKDLLLVKKGGHYGLGETGGLDYQNRISEFLKRQSRNN